MAWRASPAVRLPACGLGVLRPAKVCCPAALAENGVVGFGAWNNESVAGLFGRPQCGGRRAWPAVLRSWRGYRVIGEREGE